MGTKKRDRRDWVRLDWWNKSEVNQTTPGFLLEYAGISYASKRRAQVGDIFSNKIIYGDNLLALKALESEFKGAVKCVFLDPPYNTGLVFEHYHDRIEHSKWLNFMRDRLVILRELLADDGSLWITIDDNEGHYLKVLCDEVLGRSNFVANIIWQKKFAAQNDARYFSSDHDHILVYAKNKPNFKINRLERTAKANALYNNPDNDPRGMWKAGDYTCRSSIDDCPQSYYPITNPNTGKVIYPKKQRVWRYSIETHKKHLRENSIYWGVNGEGNVPRIKTFLSEIIDKGRVPQTIWGWEDVGHNMLARQEQAKLNIDNLFSNSKPEKLLHRILELATNPRDIVLDPFGGSGTTAAVAHKTGRRWLTIEQGTQCQTHIIPRMMQVIDGTDQGGISEATNWIGGGGFRYYQML